MAIKINVFPITWFIGVPLVGDKDCQLKGIKKTASSHSILAEPNMLCRNAVLVNIMNVPEIARLKLEMLKRLPGRDLGSVARNIVKGMKNII